ncbi:hypothetical protein SAMN05216223_102215 [Actinacidiphila yanglinensis]|uniref:Lipoprotein n=1 Tax=Actinacidiphila yanglinensis TaxID=310779 RepID=A0A1H5VCH4_9ACTN|nr:hypothetical protein [Actinacidiphila yanglinensis]SEF84157.1 hypothetical protein SAMN05216223_102215 [Actinacidiphila yanglinensis]
MAATRRISAALIAVAAAAAVLTGCGGDDDSAGDPIVAPAGTLEQTGPFAGESADQILSDAEAATNTASSLTVDIRGTDDGGGKAHLTAAITASGKCAASVETDGESPTQVIGVDEKYYFKGDAAYWEDVGGSHGDELAQAFGGKWVEVPADESDQFDQFCNLHDLLASDDDSPITKGAPTTHYGQPVVPLREQDDDEGDGPSVLYVAAEGTPYILGVESENLGTIRFTDFDKAPEISAPPARDTVDPRSVGGDLPSLSV